MHGGLSDGNDSALVLAEEWKSKLVLWFFNGCSYVCFMFRYTLWMDPTSNIQQQDEEDAEYALLMDNQVDFILDDLMKGEDPTKALDAMLSAAQVPIPGVVFHVVNLCLVVCACACA